MKNMTVLSHVPRFIPYEAKWTSTSLPGSTFFGKAEGESYLPSQVSYSIELGRILEMDVCQGSFKAMDPVFQSVLSPVGSMFTNSAYASERLAVSQLIELFLLSDSASHSAGIGQVGSFSFAGKTKAQCLAEPTVIALFTEFYDDLQILSYEAFKVKWRDYLYFSVALKREMLKKAKVSSGKTRMFLVAPLFHHLACFGYFHQYTEAWYHDNQNDLRPGGGNVWPTPGCNWMGSGWDAFARKMNRSRPSAPTTVYNCTDITGMDLHVSPDHFGAGRDFLAAARDDQAMAVRTLFDVAMNAECVTSRGVVFLKHGSNPSGWYLTLWLNTFIMACLVYTWYKVNEPFATHDQIMATIRAAVCGDDSVITHNPADFSNVHSFASVCDERGYPASLAIETTDFAHVEYCGAMKSLRSSVSGMRWVRYPRVQKFLDSLLYIETNSDAIEYQRACSILQELWPLSCDTQDSSQRDIYNKVRSYAEHLRSRNLLVCQPPPATCYDHRFVHLGF